MRPTGTFTTRSGAGRRSATWLRNLAGRDKLPNMGPFAVSQGKQDALARRMAELGVREQDLVESFVRSGGPGGQNVNKVSSCVLLMHRPSGLQVKCQRHRQQALNRFEARRLLLDRIEAQRTGQVAAQRARIEKIRRQKRRRSRRARQRMLADKAHRAGVKQLRQRVGAGDD
jgi:protein subunit release factor B